MTIETRYIIASNLTVAAALLQLVNVAKHKTTTSKCDSEAEELFRTMLSLVEKPPASE